MSLRTRSRAPLCLLIALGLLSACGSSGGGGQPEALPEIDLGVLSATVPTRVGRSYLNPFALPATVSALPASGPFAFDPGVLPAQVGPLQAINLDVIFTPAGTGAAEGVATLQFVAGTDVSNQSILFKATGEAITFTQTPDPADFGDVLPGNTSELDIDLRNDSSRSPVTFTSGSLPGAAFSYVGSPFPLSIQPGQTGTLRLRFSPTLIADQGGIFRIGSGDPGGPVDIQLWANSSGSGEQVVDFGTQALGGGNTPVLSVDVPADALSVTFEGVMGDSDQVGLRMLEGPGGHVYENVSQTGPVLWVENPKAFSIHLPSSDAPATQLVAGGGTYRFQLYRFSGSGTTMDVRVLIERRATGASGTTILPLNVFLAQGLTPDKATAASNANLQSMLNQMGQILSAQSLQLGKITYYDISDASFDNISQGEEAQLFKLSSQAEKVRLNLFLVNQVWGGQLLGLSGAIDGTKQNGLSVTGVVALYFDAQPGAIAAVVAHEICHYLGLYHTVEINGLHDPILDTPNCPAFGTSAACMVEGGGLLMHWQGIGGTILSSGQGRVIGGHACGHPTGQSDTKPRLTTPWQPDEATRRYLQDLPAGWCGTRSR